MHFPGPRPRIVVPTSVLVLAIVASMVAAQPPEEKRNEKTSAVEMIPDPAGFAPAEISPFNPLYRPFESPPRLVETPVAQDYRGKTTLFLALKLDESGNVLEAEAVDPPLRGLGPGAAAVAQRWTFVPARKDGKPVRTWASYGLDLTLDLERPVFTSFSLLPVAKEDPIPAVLKEYPGDTGLLRYPKEPAVEAGVVSIEDVDFLPAVKKNPWKLETTRLKSRLAAIVQVSPAGAVERVIPTGTSFEPFILAWTRNQVARWKIAPALDHGVARRAFMSLDLVAEYEIVRAKDSAKRLLKKNLKGSPVG